MSQTATSCRTSRRFRRCDHAGCRIRRGHRYVRVALFPGHELVPRTTLDLHPRPPRPAVLLQCVGCAVYAGEAYGSEGRFGDEYAPGLNACETFCCGVDPCARPFNHGGDHSCRRCPEEIR